MKFHSFFVSTPTRSVSAEYGYTCPVKKLNRHARYIDILEDRCETCSLSEKQENGRKRDGEFSFTKKFSISFLEFECFEVSEPTSNTERERVLDISIYHKCHSKPFTHGRYILLIKPTTSTCINQIIFQVLQEARLFFLHCPAFQEVQTCSSYSFLHPAD